MRTQKNLILYTGEMLDQAGARGVNRVLLDFVFGNYKGNFINTTARNHAVSYHQELISSEWCH